MDVTTSSFEIGIGTSKALQGAATIKTILAGIRAGITDFTKASKEAWSSLDEDAKPALKTLQGELKSAQSALVDVQETMAKMDESSTEVAQGIISGFSKANKALQSMTEIILDVRDAMKDNSVAAEQMSAAEVTAIRKASAALKEYNADLQRVKQNMDKVANTSSADVEGIAMPRRRGRPRKSTAAQEVTAAATPVIEEPAISSASEAVQRTEVANAEQLAAKEAEVNKILSEQTSEVERLATAYGNQAKVGQTAAAATLEAEKQQEAELKKILNLQSEVGTGGRSGPTAPYYSQYKSPYTTTPPPLPASAFYGGGGRTPAPYVSQYGGIGGGGGTIPPPPPTIPPPSGGGGGFRSNVGSSVDDLYTKLGKVKAGVQGLEEQFGTSSGRIVEHVKFIASSIALMGTAFHVGEVFVNFEKEMSGVQAVMGDRLGKTTQEAGENFDKLRAKAEDLGSRTVFNAVQAAEGLKYLGQAGLSVNQVMEASESTLYLAHVGQIELGEAAKITASAMMTFGLSAKDVGKIVDQMAYAAKHSLTSVEEMSTAFRYAGPTAHLMGIQIGELIPAIEVLAQSGIRGSQAGTGLRMMLNTLAKDTAEAESGTTRLSKGTLMLEASLKAAGLTIKDVNPTTHTLEQVMTALDKANISAGASTNIFTRNSGTTNTVLTQNISTLKEYIEAEKHVTDQAKIMSQTLLNNVAGDFKKMIGAFDQLVLVTGDGSGLRGVLRNAINDITGMIHVLSGTASSADENILKFRLMAAALSALIVAVTAYKGIGLALSFLEGASAVGQIVVGMLGAKGATDALQVATVKRVTASLAQATADVAEAVALKGKTAEMRLLAESEIELATTESARTAGEEKLASAEALDAIATEGLAAANRQLTAAQGQAAVSGSGLLSVMGKGGWVGVAVGVLAVVAAIYQLTKGMDDATLAAKRLNEARGIASKEIDVKGYTRISGPEASAIQDEVNKAEGDEAQEAERKRATSNILQEHMRQATKDFNTASQWLDASSKKVDELQRKVDNSVTTWQGKSLTIAARSLAPNLTTALKVTGLAKDKVSESSQLNADLEAAQREKAINDQKVAQLREVRDTLAAQIKSNAPAGETPKIEQTAKGASTIVEELKKEIDTLGLKEAESTVSTFTIKLQEDFRRIDALVDTARKKGVSSVNIGGINLPLDQYRQVAREMAQNAATQKINDLKDKETQKVKEVEDKKASTVQAVTDQILHLEENLSAQRIAISGSTINKLLFEEERRTSNELVSLEKLQNARKAAVEAAQKVGLHQIETTQGRGSGAYAEQQQKDQEELLNLTKQSEREKSDFIIAQAKLTQAKIEELNIQAGELIKADREKLQQNYLTLNGRAYEATRQVNDQIYENNLQLYIKKYGLNSQYYNDYVKLQDQMRQYELDSAEKSFQELLTKTKAETEKLRIARLGTSSVGTKAAGRGRLDPEIYELQNFYTQQMKEGEKVAQNENEIDQYRAATFQLMIEKMQESENQFYISRRSLVEQFGRDMVQAFDDVAMGGTKVAQALGTIEKGMVNLVYRMVVMEPLEKNLAKWMKETAQASERGEGGILGTVFSKIGLARTPEQISTQKGDILGKIAQAVPGSLIRPATPVTNLGQLGAPNLNAPIGGTGAIPAAAQTQLPEFKSLEAAMSGNSSAVKIATTETSKLASTTTDASELSKIANTDSQAGTQATQANTTTTETLQASIDTLTASVDALTTAIEGEGGEGDSGGGGLMGLLSGLFTGAATGGPVQSGQNLMVAEEGMEAFIPNSALKSVKDTTPAANLIRGMALLGKNGPGLYKPTEAGYILNAQDTQDFIKTGMLPSNTKFYAEGGGVFGGSNVIAGDGNGPELYVPSSAKGGASEANTVSVQPHVNVNVVNKSGRQMTADQGETKFDGKQYVVDIILNDVQNNGPIRKVLGQR